jgi:hypothetical protein
VVDEAKEQESAGEQQAEEVSQDVGEAAIVAEAAEHEETETEALQRELGETRDQLMRVAAEFDNFRKRMEREKSKLLKYAGENILRDLLGTLDNLERAVEQGSADAGDEPKMQSMLQGVELTRKGLAPLWNGMVSSRWPLLAWLLIRMSMTPLPWSQAIRYRPIMYCESLPKDTGSRTGSCGTPRWLFPADREMRLDMARFGRKVK